MTWQNPYGLSGGGAASLTTARESRRSNARARGAQLSNASAGDTRYLAPNITRVALDDRTQTGGDDDDTGDGAAVLLRPAGGEYVNVSGLHFGPRGTRVALSYENRDANGGGGLAASRFEPACWVAVAHVLLRCVTAAGVGVEHGWNATIGGQPSIRQSGGGGDGGAAAARATTSYRPPRIDAFDAASVDRPGLSTQARSQNGMRHEDLISIPHDERVTDPRLSTRARSSDERVA